MSTDKGQRVGFTDVAPTEENKKASKKTSTGGDLFDCAFVMLLCDFELVGLAVMAVGMMLFLCSWVCGGTSEEQKGSEHTTKSIDTSDLMSPMSRTETAAPSPIDSKSNVCSGTDLDAHHDQNSKTTMRR